MKVHKPRIWTMICIVVVVVVVVLFLTGGNRGQQEEILISSPPARMNKESYELCDWGCYLSRNKDLSDSLGTNVTLASQHYTDYGYDEGRVCTCQDLCYFTDGALSSALNGSIDLSHMPSCTKQLASSVSTRFELALTSDILSVGVFGGSISKGSGLFHNYADLLELLLGRLFDRPVVVTNFAIGASGVDRWIMCGLPTGFEFDIIISEFRINEGGRDRLKQWYNLARRSSQLVIILDLWSWLTEVTEPPILKQHPTIEALPADTGGFDVLELHKLFHPYWVHKIAPFDTWNMFPIRWNLPRLCHQAYQDGNTSIVKECSKKYAHGMQHGNELYHEVIADTLAWHLFQTVSFSKREGIRKPTAPWGSHSQCYGIWGLRESVSVEDLQDRAVYVNGFMYGSAFGKSRKTSFYSNQSQSELEFKVLPGFHLVQVGYIYHDLPTEGGTLLLEGGLETTRVHTSGTEPTIQMRRIRKYAQVGVAFERLRIRTLFLTPGSVVEITDLIFKCADDESYLNDGRTCAWVREDPATRCSDLTVPGRWGSVLIQRTFQDACCAACQGLVNDMTDRSVDRRMFT